MNEVVIDDSQREMCAVLVMRTIPLYNNVSRAEALQCVSVT